MSYQSKPSPVLPQPLIYFFERHTLYIGDLPDTQTHRPAVAALAVGLRGGFRLHAAKSPPAQCQTALMPPNFTHRAAYGGRSTAILYLQPGDGDYDALRGQMTRPGPGCLLALKNESRVIDTLSAIYADQPPAAACRRRLDALLGRPAADKPPSGKPAPQSGLLDRRISQTLATLHRDPARNHPLESLAAAVYLSATRFTHLFKNEVGAPMRRYRQWLRFLATMRAVAAGETMTVAARNAGFTDSAHFSRAFRSMFGTRPSAMLKSKRQIKAFAP